MAYTQKPGRGNGDPIMKLSDRLKEGSGLQPLATMYGAPVEMKANNGPLPQSGLNYGAPLQFHGEEHNSGDSLPSYDTTTYNASASSSGGGSSSQNLSTSNLSDYKSTLKDLGSGFTPTKEQTAAANAKVAKLKALDRSNAAANAASKTNSSQSSSESTSTSTTTLGDQTLNQIKKGGNIEVQNRASRVNATREAARNQAVIDSTNTANKFINSKPISMQDNPSLINVAQRRGNLAAKKSLLRSGTYNTSTVSKMVKKGENYLGTE